MPRSKVCPRCGDLAEVKTYVTPSGKPMTVAKWEQSTRNQHENLEDLDVWECDCGWAEDVDE